MRGLGLRPGYRGYFVEAQWITDHWVFVVFDIQGEEVDRFSTLSDVQTAIDSWTTGVEDGGLVR